MPRSSGSYLLSELSWTEVRAHLARDRRLIVPVGALDQYGPHLPIGTGTWIAEALARDLSTHFGVLRAPAIPYGVNVEAERAYAGTAALREKTLHRVVNDLLASWEDHGFAEFILITVHTYDPHVEAIATVTGVDARVRVIEPLAIDFSRFLEGQEVAQHGGEVETSLMLYLHPDLVNLERARDFVLPRRRSGALPPRPLRLPASSPGSVGRPTCATTEKGRVMYEHMLEKIRNRVFLAPPTQEG